MNKLAELQQAHAEIGAYVEHYYATLDPATLILDLITPLEMRLKIAAEYPDLGGAFYRLVQDAAYETYWGRPVPEPPALPPMRRGLRGLINSLDSSWF